MPCIHFDGQCAPVMAFYTQVLAGTDLQQMLSSEAPPDGAMTPSGRNMVAPPTVDAAHKMFDALCEGSTVIMPFGTTFWSPGFGVTQDRFGTHRIIGAAG